MLEYCVPWPPEIADRYRSLGVWLDETIDEAISRVARRTPANVAIVAQRSKLTYAELDAKSERLADGLYHAGFRPGDRMVVQLPNNAEFAMPKRTSHGAAEHS